LACFSKWYCWRECWRSIFCNEYSENKMTNGTCDELMNHCFVIVIKQRVLVEDDLARLSLECFSVDRRNPSIFFPFMLLVYSIMHVRIASMFWAICVVAMHIAWCISMFTVATMLHVWITFTESPYGLTAPRQNMKTWPYFLGESFRLNQPNTYTSVRKIFVAQHVRKYSIIVTVGWFYTLFIWQDFIVIRKRKRKFWMYSHPLNFPVSATAYSPAVDLPRNAQ
jgi:hypothetical protein